MEKKTLKQLYEAPAMEIVEAKYSSVICASGEGKDPWEEDD